MHSGGIITNLNLGFCPYFFLKKIMKMWQQMENWTKTMEDLTKFGEQLPPLHITDHFAWLIAVEKF